MRLQYAFLIPKRSLVSHFSANGVPGSVNATSVRRQLDLRVAVLVCSPTPPSRHLIRGGARGERPRDSCRTSLRIPTSRNVDKELQRSLRRGGFGPKRKTAHCRAKGGEALSGARPVVESRGIEVSAIRPDQRIDLRIDRHLTKTARDRGSGAKISPSSTGSKSMTCSVPSSKWTRSMYGATASKLTTRWMG